MDKHASMNRAYRLVWSAARKAFVVAAETAKGRSKSSRGARRSAAAVIAVGLGLPALAFAQAVPATVVPVSGNATAYVAPNGVPVVNINAANGAGLSHNQYNRFDVERNGLVLNNGNISQMVRQSQLAGQVLANPNLSAEARVILNEVVASNRSRLNGFTEVLGGRADVILANPYGITCTGCGFINTDRVTLTTGQPNFRQDGGLAGFAVQRGDVLINGDGLNASAQQILDIVTRSIRIDGTVHAADKGSLGIVTGANQWNYNTREVTGSATPTGAKPDYAIDTGTLGGMYAGRIRLVATEAGVGVRMLGDAAARADDFRLDAAGRVQMQGRVSARRDLQVASAGNLDIMGEGRLNGRSASLAAGHDMVLHTDGGDIRIGDGTLYSGQQLELEAVGRNITNQVDGTLDATDIKVSAANLTNQGTIVADRDITIDVARQFNNLFAGGTFTGRLGDYSYQNTTMPYDSGDHDCNVFGKACDWEHVLEQKFTARQKLDGNENAPVARIIAGNTLDLRYGESATNRAALIAAPNLKISGKGDFNNTDIALDEIAYVRRWGEAKSGKTFGDNGYVYSYPTRDAEYDRVDGRSFSGRAGSFDQARDNAYKVETGRATYKTFKAAVYAGNVSVDTDGGVRLKGSAFESMQAGGAAIQPDVALPGNPNGHFVVTTDPRARYLVETNPIYGVDADFVGSEYLSQRLGFDPDEVHQRLGDGNYEARLIAKSGVTALKGGKSAAEQMIVLMDSAIHQAGDLGLAYGKALTPEQQARLKNDLVWMVEQNVAGRNVLVPVVYLAPQTRALIEGNAVLAANKAAIHATSMTNEGATVAARDRLDITTKGDIHNLSGVVRGGDATLTSTEGSIVNDTRASTEGGRDFQRTVVGKRGVVQSEGELRLDAAKNISVAGADVKAGGNATLVADGDVTIDTVQNKSADANYKATRGFWGLTGSQEASRDATSKNIGSTVRSEGVLTIGSGKNTTIAGSETNGRKGMNIGAKSKIAVQARQDTSESMQSTSSKGVFSSNSKTTDKSENNHAGSTLKTDGNLAAKTDALTMQGAKVDASGSVTIDARTVDLKAGSNTQKATTKTEESGWFTASKDSDSKAEAKPSSAKSSTTVAGKAAAKAGAQAEGELKLYEARETTESTDSSKAVVTTLTAGKDLKVINADRMVMEGSDVNVGGDADLKVKDLQVTAAKNTSTSTTSSNSNSVGIYWDAHADAGAEAGGRASENGGGSVRGKAEAKAEAGASATAGWRGKQGDETASSTTNAGASIKVGGNLSTQGDKASFEGSKVDADGNIDMQARSIDVKAVQDTKDSTSSSTTRTAGIYVEANAGASASVSGSASTNGMTPMANAQGDAGAGIQGEVGAGLKYQQQSKESTNGTSTAVTSSFKAGGNMTRKADTITDQGTAYEAGGDFHQEAGTLTMKAAENKSYESSSKSSHEAKLGVYAEAHAKVSAAGTGNAVSPSSGVDTDVNAGYGVKARYDYKSESEAKTASTAVTGSVKADGALTSSSTGKTMIEGATLQAGKDASVTGASVEIAAARNTTSETKSSTNIGAGVQIDVKGKGSAADGAYGKENSKSSTSDAVTATIKGNNVRVEGTQGDVRVEGASIDAAGKASLQAQGNVTVDAARNESSSSETTVGIKAAINTSNSNPARMLSAGGEYNSSDKTTSTAQAAKIGGKDGIEVTAGKDARFEGTQLRTDGDASVKADGAVRFDAAKSTETGNSYRAEGSIGSQRSKESKTTNSAGIGLGYETIDKANSATAAVDAGGKLSVSGKEVTSQDATLTGKGGKEVQGTLNETKADNHDRSQGFDIDFRGKHEVAGKADKASDPKPGAQPVADSGGRGKNEPAPHSEPVADQDGKKRSASIQDPGKGPDAQVDKKADVQPAGGERGRSKSMTANHSEPPAEQDGRKRAVSTQEPGKGTGAQFDKKQDVQPVGQAGVQGNHAPAKHSDAVAGQDGRQRAVSVHEADKNAGPKPDMKPEVSAAGVPAAGDPAAGDPRDRSKSMAVNRSEPVPDQDGKKRAASMQEPGKGAGASFDKKPDMPQVQSDNATRERSKSALAGSTDILPAQANQPRAHSASSL